MVFTKYGNVLAIIQKNFLSPLFFRTPIIGTSQLDVPWLTGVLFIIFFSVSFWVVLLLCLHVFSCSVSLAVNSNITFVLAVVVFLSTSLI